MCLGCGHPGVMRQSRWGATLGMVGAWVLGLAMVVLAGQLEHLNFDPICIIKMKEYKQWCSPAPVDLERVPVAVPLLTDALRLENGFSSVTV